MKYKISGNSVTSFITFILLYQKINKGRQKKIGPFESGATKD